MAYPFAPRTSDKYLLLRPVTTGPGWRATFNDPTDVFYVGALRGVEGLESAEVRESADELVQADGGAHGDFWLGRRPVILSGAIFNHATFVERDARISRLTSASHLLRPHNTRGEGGLIWMPAETIMNWWPNPGAEGTSDLTSGEVRGFYSTLAGTVATVGTPVFSGSSAFRFTASAGGTATFWHTHTTRSPVYDTNSFGVYSLASGLQGGPYALDDAAQRVPVTPGVTYRAEGRFRSAATSRNVTANIIWYDATGATISTSSGSAVATTTSSWVQPFVSAAAPATAAFAQPTFSMPNVANAEVHYADALYFGNGGSYVDGSTAGYYWWGAPNMSPSGSAIPMWLPLRKQSRLAITGAWNKEFQLPLVSEEAYIQSLYRQNVLSAVAGNAVATTRGTAEVYPIITIYASGGTWNGLTMQEGGSPQFQLTATGSPPAFSGSDSLVIDTKRRQAYKNGTNSGSWNRYINWNSSSWPIMTPDVAATFIPSFSSGSGVRVQVTFRDAWL